MEKVIEEIIEVLITNKIINRHALRDFLIKRKYRELRESGMTGKEARRKIAEEEHLSEKAIEYILYGKKG